MRLSVDRPQIRRCLSVHLPRCVYLCSDHRYEPRLSAACRRCEGVYLETLPDAKASVWTPSPDEKASICKRSQIRAASICVIVADTSCVYLALSTRCEGVYVYNCRQLATTMGPLKVGAPPLLSPRAITPPYDSEARIMMQQRWARVLRATPCGHRPGCPVSLTDPASWQPSTDSAHGPYRATTAAVYAPRLPGVSTQNLARNPPLT
jgi:hypothetical protein